MRADITVFTYPRAPEHNRELPDAGASANRLRLAVCEVMYEIIGQGSPSSMSGCCFDSRYSTENIVSATQRAH